MKNMEEEQVEQWNDMIWKIWKKSKMKSEKIWKKWKKGKLYSEMIWKI